MSYLFRQILNHRKMAFVNYFYLEIVNIKGKKMAVVAVLLIEDRCLYKLHLVIQGSFTAK